MIWLNGFAQRYCSKATNPLETWGQNQHSCSASVSLTHCSFCWRRSTDLENSINILEPLIIHMTLYKGHKITLILQAGNLTEFKFKEVRNLAQNTTVGLLWQGMGTNWMQRHQRQREETIKGERGGNQAHRLSLEPKTYLYLANITGVSWNSSGRSLKRS